MSTHAHRQRERKKSEMKGEIDSVKKVTTVVEKIQDTLMQNFHFKAAAAPFACSSHHADIRTIFQFIFCWVKRVENFM